MFMTERTGGSDVGAIETTARREGDHWLLNGLKWFCSNVDARAIATLARPEGAPPGVKGLALFLVPHTRRDGTPNGIHVRRIKDKLGTRVVPTGEVDFVDCEGYLLAGSDDPEAAYDGRGINRMMEMVDTSRLGVATMGLGIMRRAFLEAAIYAARRVAFGQRIWEYAPVQETLVRMAVEVEAALALVLEAAQAGTMTGYGERLYRVLVPLAKMRATRRGVELAVQAVETIGGNGYIEDWPTARILRDAQCHTLWEGTENIICLDVLRAARKEQAHEALLDRIDAALAAAGHLPEAEVVRRERLAAERAFRYVLAAQPREAQLKLRRAVEYLADVTQAALLLEAAAWQRDTDGSERGRVVARIFARERLQQPVARGIEDGDVTVLRHFEDIVCYRRVAEG